MLKFQSSNLSTAGMDYFAGRAPWDPLRPNIPKTTCRLKLWESFPGEAVTFPALSEGKLFMILMSSTADGVIKYTRRNSTW